MHTPFLPGPAHRAPEPPPPPPPHPSVTDFKVRHTYSPELVAVWLALRTLYLTTAGDIFTPTEFTHLLFIRWLARVGRISG